MNALEKRQARRDLERTLKAWGNKLPRIGGCFFRPPELPKHYLLKSCVCLLLQRKGHDYMTEVRTSTGRFMDVFDLETGLNYEIQNAGEKATCSDGAIILDTIVIPVEKCPDEFLAALVWLEKYLT